MSFAKLVTVCAFLAAVFASAPGLAASATGKIKAYQLNSDIPGRGVCVAMNPALPGSGWACLWKNNFLYPEITDLLRDAFISEKTCSVNWITADARGDALIAIVECSK